jgi:hypothetical protein
MRKAVYSFCAAIWMAAMTVNAQDVKPMIQIPYSPKEVGHCYERLHRALPAYREARAGIEAVIRSGAGYSERLQKVLALHAEVLERVRADGSDPEGVDEGIYLCCLYDMLEAMVAAEAESVSAGPLPASGKRAQLESIGESIRNLPFGSPQFKTGIRRRLEGHVSGALKKLSDD